jgi:hypothetical protein
MTIGDWNLLFIISTMELIMHQLFNFSVTVKKRMSLYLNYLNRFKSTQFPCWNYIQPVECINLDLPSDQISTVPVLVSIRIFFVQAFSLRNSQHAVSIASKRESRQRRNSFLFLREIFPVCFFLNLIEQCLMLQQYKHSRKTKYT